MALNNDCWFVRCLSFSCFLKTGQLESIDYRYIYTFSRLVFVLFSLLFRPGKTASIDCFFVFDLFHRRCFFVLVFRLEFHFIVVRCFFFINSCICFLISTKTKQFNFLNQWPMAMLDLVSEAKPKSSVAHLKSSKIDSILRHYVFDRDQPSIHIIFLSMTILFMKSNELNSLVWTYSNFLFEVSTQTLVHSI